MSISQIGTAAFANNLTLSGNTVLGNVSITGTLTVVGNTYIENVNISNTQIVTSDFIIAPTVNTQVINSGTSNTLTLQTNNTTAITVSNTQYVGIGTSSPAAQLDVLTTGNIARFVSSASGQGNMYLACTNASTPVTGYIGANAYTNNVWALGTNTSYPVAFYTNASERMRIASNGYVGINTTNPGYNLTVGGTVAMTFEKGSAYSATYTYTSSWASGLQTIVPTSTLSGDYTYLVTITTDASLGTPPYFASTAFLFRTAPATNGGGTGVQISQITSTHVATSCYWSVASLGVGGFVCPGIAAQLVNGPSTTVSSGVSVYVMTITN